MPIQERKLSFGDPLTVYFLDILVVPKLLCINDFGKVKSFIDPGGVAQVFYKDNLDGVWEQIDIAPSGDEEEIRGEIIEFIGGCLLDLYPEGLESFNPEDFQFAIGPAIRVEMETRKPFLAKDKRSVGIWHKQT